LGCIDQINQHRSRYYGTIYVLQISLRLQSAYRNKLNLVIGRQANCLMCNIGIKEKQAKQQQVILVQVKVIT
jgi:hypothetical protein